MAGEAGGDGRVVRGEFRPDGVEREWCDDDVLRQLRRRSLAVLRREVEPVDGRALARFLPAWHGVGSNRRGVDGLVDVLGVLSGAAIPASVLEADVLSARLAEYHASDLDVLCTSGEVVWVGAGAIGASDGRIRLVFRDQAPLLVPRRPRSISALAMKRCSGISKRGASFWPELVQAIASADLRYDDGEVLTALWDLVWGGLVTNDSLGAAAGPREGATGAPRDRPPPAGSAGSARTARRFRSMVARRSIARAAPVGDRDGARPRVAAARALRRVDPRGRARRGPRRGFAGVYPVLKALEERGPGRRGYFVAGLGAAQFALPGAVDRLRSHREPGDSTVVLAATDPAQPYGAALPWPESDGRPARRRVRMSC